MIFNKKISWKTLVVELGIALLCFGYFAAYVPYSTLTKMISKGLLPEMNGVGLPGPLILPATALASFICMYIFLTAIGWWKYATNRRRFFGLLVPMPTRYTFASGICTAVIIMTTTLAYTFSSVSVVFMMLLMRGGVLVMAPPIDWKTGKTIHWPALVAAGLSLAALVVSFVEKAGTGIEIVCLIDVAFYIAGYFIRLRFMNTQAGKCVRFSAQSDEEKLKLSRKYFVEEQLVANPLLFVGLFIVGLCGIGLPADTTLNQIWRGFVELPLNTDMLIWCLLIGACSYGTGLFGTLIFLDNREHTFCAPANRIASIFAGVICDWYLWKYYEQKPISNYTLWGVALVTVAIIFLLLHPLVAKKIRLYHEHKAAAVHV
jgi:uncharacterized membrane protein YdcZ (DUF606 family)